MMEKWVPIKGYEGYYEVSSEGNVRSVDRVIRYKNGHYQKFKSRTLKPKITMQGYEQVDLSKNNKVKQVKVHRLVAENFVSNPYGKPQINHIDGIKLNNNVRNLEWCTAEYNMNYGTAMQRAKETYASHYDRSAIAKNNAIKKKVIQYTLDGKYIKEWDSLTDIQNELGFCRSNISKCCEGKYKQANNFIWKFKKD